MKTVFTMPKILLLCCKLHKMWRNLFFQKKTMTLFTYRPHFNLSITSFYCSFFYWIFLKWKARKKRWKRVENKLLFVKNVVITLHTAFCQLFSNHSSFLFSSSLFFRSLVENTRKSHVQYEIFEIISVSYSLCSEINWKTINFLY